MNEDLKWLATNVHEWPRHDVTGIGLDPDGEFRAYGDTGCTLDYYPDPLPDGIAKRIGNHYTRAQWQAARDELSGKPSWDDAPENAAYLCQDPDGWWEWFSHKPSPMEREWPGGEKPSDGFIECGPEGILLGDWRNTLERRPQSKKTYTVDEVIDELDIRQEVNEASVAMGLREWRGPEDGLPPVGKWVQFEQADEAGEGLDGLECYVISNGKDESGYDVTTVFFKLHGYKAFMSDCFHPIRTEEDKAAEEMASLLGFPECPATQQVCRDLYRAGYRKQESK